MKYIIPVLLVVMLLSGCSRFDKKQFMSSDFGGDLSSLVDQSETDYVDGCLQVYDVDITVPSDTSYFADTFEETTYFEFDDLGFSDSDCGTILYRNAKDSFDGYQPVIVYIPKLKRLIFGYSTGIGG